MERKVMEQVGKAGEAEWNEGRRKRRYEAINATMRVGQLVTAVEDFTEWEDPSTWLSFSKLSLSRCWKWLCSWGELASWGIGPLAGM
jgi:hypothetical protein